jgi:hypothetical protein
VGKTFNPPKLVELGKFWTARGGKNLGVIGDGSHINRGVSYHLGRDALMPTAYSIELKRDKGGLSDAASAIDLGRLDGKLIHLREFTLWLVDRCTADPAVRRDIREIIYTADGETVQRYSGVDNKIHTGPGNGDKSHLTHTHISFFRDSQERDKVGFFRPFFEPGWGPDVPPEIRALDPKTRATARALRMVGHHFGSVIDLDDLKAGLTKKGHDFGTIVDTSDAQVLIGKQ